MADIKSTIKSNINTIHEILKNQNKFLSDINAEVEDLTGVVNTLITYCKKAKQDLSVQINNVGVKSKL